MRISHFFSSETRKKPSSPLSWKVQWGTWLKAAKTHEITFRGKKGKTASSMQRVPPLSYTTKSIVQYQPTDYKATKKPFFKHLRYGIPKECQQYILPVRKLRTPQPLFRMDFVRLSITRSRGYLRSSLKQERTFEFHQTDLTLAKR